MLLKHQSMTIEIFTPSKPRCRYFPSMYESTTLNVHILIIDMVIVYLASPAALKKLGKVKDIGQIKIVQISRKRLFIILSLIASSDRLYRDDKNGVVT